MIRTVGRLGVFRVAGLVLWQLRYTLLAILVAVGLLIPVPDPTWLKLVHTVGTDFDECFAEVVG